MLTLFDLQILIYKTTGWVIHTTIQKSSNPCSFMNTGHHLESMSKTLLKNLQKLCAARSGHSYYSALNIGWETDGERHL